MADAASRPRETGISPQIDSNQNEAKLRGRATQ